jgi:hypothetical protein
LHEQHDPVLSSSPPEERPIIQSMAKGKVAPKARAAKKNGRTASSHEDEASTAVVVAAAARAPAAPAAAKNEN